MKQSDSGEVLLLKSKYLTNEEKSKIIISGIHKAHDEFLNHPITQGTIFVLTSVITAGSLTGISSAAQMVSRNVLKPVLRYSFVKGSELTAKTIMAKAFVSASYQALTQKGEINLLTVIGDSFFTPYVGAALGNTFTLSFNFVTMKGKAETVFDKNKSTKHIVSALVKTIIAGSCGKHGGTDYNLLGVGISKIMLANTANSALANKIALLSGDVIEK